MQDKKFEIIQKLMEELKEEMQPSADDLEMRLGRKKPDLEMVKIEGKVMDPEKEQLEEKLGMDLDGDKEEGESLAHKALVLGDEDEGEEFEMESPEEKLKNRLMKLRGV